MQELNGTSSAWAMHLDPWAKLAIMAGGAGVVAITVLVVVCVVGPGCCLYECFHKAEKRRLKSRSSSGSSPHQTNNNGKPVLSYSGTSETDSAEAAVLKKALLDSSSSPPSGVLAIRGRKDSTYSSMSSGRTSPTASMHSAFSAFSFPKSESKGKNANANVTASVAWKEDEGGLQGTLHVTVEHANDLPPRDYAPSCDPYIQLLVLKDRGRSLRKRTQQVIAEFNTKPIRHALNPIYSQTFPVADIQSSDLRNIRLKFSAFDYDRHSKVTLIGSTNVCLKDLKTLGTEKITLTQALTQKKQDFGDILFGMSYLPTAQRLSFSIIKANNLKHDGIVENLGDFCPYVRILQLSPSGRVVKKKKTTVQTGSTEPVFNETLNFELAPAQLETMVFLLMVSHRQSSMEMKDYRDSPVHFRDRDACIGRISLGRAVQDEKSRGHWHSVTTTPRKVFSMWHSLK